MAIQLTDRAVNRINELKVKRQTPDHFFRIGIRGGGCSGLSYFVDFAEAELIKNAHIAAELALPPVKIHCSVLAEDAIKAAIADYRKKRGEGEA